MEKQLLGFLLLLVGMGAIFGIWVITLRDRSKTIEAVEPATGPSERPEKRAGAYTYSLAPLTQDTPARRHSTAPERVSDLGLPVTPEIQSVEATILAPDDDLARTHLEIARQFFDQGDFEGAGEMCSLVLDNPEASPGQLEQAKLLQLECQ